MQNTTTFRENEKGLAIVEAAIILPFCILMVLSVYYAAIFMCQRANLQANLQNTLVYYKNADSDNWVEPATGMAYTLADKEVSGGGDSYNVDGSLFPYRFFGMNFDESNFKKFFRSMSGFMFFDDGTNIELSVKHTNWVIYKSIEATATQTVKPAVDLSMVGFPSELTIKASGEVVITNGDDFIRNIDFIYDIVAKSKLGDMISSLVEKASNLYDSLKGRFNL